MIFQQNVKVIVTHIKTCIHLEKLAFYRYKKFSFVEFVQIWFKDLEKRFRNFCVGQQIVFKREIRYFNPRF